MSAVTITVLRFSVYLLDESGRTGTVVEPFIRNCKQSGKHCTNEKQLNYAKKCYLYCSNTNNSPYMVNERPAPYILLFIYKKG